MLSRLGKVVFWFCSLTAIVLMLPALGGLFFIVVGTAAPDAWLGVGVFAVLSLCVYAAGRAVLYVLGE